MATAQNTGGVKGKVRNMRGDNLPGATITARQNSQDVKTATAGSKGEFVLSGLDAGVYNLAFEAKGYEAAVQYNVEIKKGDMRDLGNRLILMVDKGSLVIIQGSVFYKGGTSVRGAEVKVERVNPDGSTKKITTEVTDISGEISIRAPRAGAKYRFTAKFKGATTSKEIEVENTGRYHI
ncbi:MAG: carboxypeptidase-like regulatory domain-containing protein, partial [Pyrinomonadaceae bacterium]